MVSRLLRWLILSLTCVISGAAVPGVGGQWPEREFRGAWVATVSDIDWPLSRTDSVTKQQHDLHALIVKLHHQGFNAIVFQIRAQGDAMYHSSLEPWSRDLTGSQGTAPSPLWDPLQYVIAEAHARSMEVHAWFNPYRARAGSTSTSGLAHNHMCHTLHQYCYAYGSDLYMDPGVKAVQDRTYDVIMDVVTRYDVDGVHMDDYFYPYPVAGKDFPDSATYNAYKAGGGTLGHDDWRRHNVDTLIERLYKGVKAKKNHVKVGLSPFGIWQSHHPTHVVGFSSYSGQYADSKKWLEQGWVDYMSPQLYWKIDPPQQSFTALLDWWLAQNPKHRHLYAGVYAGHVANANWPLSEIHRQVEESRKRSSHLSLGNVFFSAKYFRDNSKGLADMFTSQLYSTPALPPAMPWLTAHAPAAPVVTVKGTTASWSADSKTWSWAVYKHNGGHWTLVHVLSHDVLSVTLAPGEYAIAAVDRLANESDASIVHVVSDQPVG